MSSSSEILGRFVWHELLTTDTEGAAAFYPKVVPWRTEPSNMPGYTIWKAGESQIGGLMELPHEGAAAHWLVYVGTPDVDETCAQVQSLGGRVLKAAADIPNVGRFAVLADPQGATFALFTPGPGQPPATQSTQGGFSWHELATSDIPGALRFYGEVFGWRKGPAHDMGPMGVYQVFEHGGTQVGGMCRPGTAHTAPSWLSYVHVADSNRAVAAAKSAGGRVVHGPVEVPGGSWVALLVDPQGCSFAVHEPPTAAAEKPATPAKAAATKPAAASKPGAGRAGAPKSGSGTAAAESAVGAAKTSSTGARSTGQPQGAPKTASTGARSTGEAQPRGSADTASTGTKRTGERRRPAAKTAQTRSRTARKTVRKRAARKSSRGSARGAARGTTRRGTRAARATRGTRGTRTRRTARGGGGRSSRRATSRGRGRRR